MKNKMVVDIVDTINQGKFTCVAMRDEDIFYQNDGIGVKPIITPMRFDRDYFKDAFVGDKIVGKAAALLFALSGVQYVYGRAMSKNAISVFQKYDIEYDYDEIVEFIENRDKTDMCPLEKSVINIDDKNLAFDVIETTILNLMRGN